MTIQTVARPCAIPGCTKPVKARGWCDSHYKRWQQWGDPLSRRRTTPAPERFWAKVNKEGPQPATFRGRGRCWQWTAGLVNSGYGRFSLTKTMPVLAHRYAYELLVGPIPEGLHIDHLCRNRACVNPAHLEPVTSAENTRRGLGVSVFNARKTHCPSGHPYSPENTYTNPRNNHRSCRACARAYQRKLRQSA